MDLFVLCVACLTVFVNSLVKQFAICLGVVVLLVNVVVLFCVLCLRSQCASRCTFHMFCLCSCMLEVTSSFKSLRAGSQVFALLMLFLCVILHIMWSGKSLQLLYILPFGMLCLSAISMMFVKLCWQCVCWWGWWSERKRAL